MNRNGSSNGGSLGVALVILLCLGAIVALNLGEGNNPLNHTKSAMGRWLLVGTVAGAPAEKTIARKGPQGSQEMQTKFAVRINVESSENNALSPGETAIVNCDSTQCSVLQAGDRVQMGCFVESRVGSGSQPDEIECRFDKLLANTPN